MPLAPTPSELYARAAHDLRLGVPVLLKYRESTALVLAAETLTRARFDDLRAMGHPLTLAITKWRAETLHQPVYDGDLVRLQIRDDAGLEWVHAMADPVQDLATPLKGPFQAIRDGDPGLARGAIALLKTAHLLPAAILMENAPELAGVQCLDLDTATSEDHMQGIVAARVPLSRAEQTRLHVFRAPDADEEHYAIEIGNPNRAHPVTTRLHSACFTGDVLGSLKCDCGPQLHAALSTLGSSDAGGILLYLNQEGRGIGLTNKMRAYALQDQGFDTVDANHRLGFEDDERDFRIAAEILQKLNVQRVRLLTNNPRKVARLEANGITVAERLPLITPRNPHNDAYLDTKATRSGHAL